MEHFEDREVGETRRFGDYPVTAEEIVAFAEQYDPQSFHVDPDAAAESMFGELVASGWHTAAMTMRMLVDNVLQDEGALGAVGVDEIRWPEPVRPGDRLHVETEVIDRERDYRSGVGLVVSRIETKREDGTVVQSQVARALYRQRDAE
jgi:acyl dehydratase